MLPLLGILSVLPYSALAEDSGLGTLPADGSEMQTNVLKDIYKGLIGLGKFLGCDDISNNCRNNSSNDNDNGGIKNFIQNQLPQALIAPLPILQAARESKTLWEIGTTVYADFGSTESSSKEISNQDVNDINNSFNVKVTLDQPEYQKLPTLQSVYNILASPFSLIQPDGGVDHVDKDWIKSLSKMKDQCPDTDVPCLFPEQVIESAGGINYQGLIDVDGKHGQEVLQSIFSTADVIAPSLSFDSLIGPILLDKKNNDDSQNQAFNDLYNGGLFGQSAIRKADAFIRYASGTILPLPKDNNLRNSITSLVKGGSGDLSKRFADAEALNEYFIKQRTYAAQASVGISNLYSLLANRLPITDADGKQITSKDLQGNDLPVTKARQEMEMAVKRFIKPSGKDAKTWADELKKSSSKDVQRQMAMLLAEMNYQMYLNRMIQQRMLATMSVLELQYLTSMREALRFVPPQQQSNLPQ